MTESVKEELLIPRRIQAMNQSKAWIDGEFNFQNESISNVWKEIERQFAVKVLYRGDQQRKYSGVFNNGDLSKALDGICGPMGLQYKINNENQELEIY